jgi:hypothetical protein
MAKRISNRSSAQDSGAAAPAQPKPRRSRSGGSVPREPETTTAASAVAASENHGAGIPREAGDDAPLDSMSMGSEPSEEDIRMRAYHRYLERGGGHGMDFEDWLEAERELKSRN